MQHLGEQAGVIVVMWLWFAVGDGLGRSKPVETLWDYIVLCSKTLSRFFDSGFFRGALQRAAALHFPAPRLAVERSDPRGSVVDHRSYFRCENAFATVYLPFASRKIRVRSYFRYRLTL